MRICFSCLGLACASTMLAITVAGCDKPAPSAQAATDAAGGNQAAIERGKFLVTIAGCDDCHTPKKLGPKGPEPDMTRRLSGHPEDLKITAPLAHMAGSPWTVATND